MILSSMIGIQNKILTIAMNSMTSHHTSIMTIRVQNLGIAGSPTPRKFESNAYFVGNLEPPLLCSLSDDSLSCTILHSAEKHTTWRKVFTCCGLYSKNGKTY